MQFKGKGWDTDSGRGDSTKDSVVFVLSEHCHIDAKGKLKKSVCGCNPATAPTRKCKGACSCWKRGQKRCSPDACRCKGLSGRVKVALEGEAPAPAEPNGNPGVGPGDESLRPSEEKEEGAPEGDGLSNASELGSDLGWPGESGYQYYSSDSEADEEAVERGGSDGGDATLEDLFEDGL